MKEQPACFVPCGCDALDKMLRGGFPKGSLSLIYGEADTGKTSLAIQCAVNCARERLKTIFIDTDGAFSTERLLQIANYDLKSISQLVILFTPKSFYEQSILIENLDSYISKNVALIIIDTITSLYRVELGGDQETFVLNRELSRQLAYMTQTARKHDVAVLILSQVHGVVGGSEGLEKIEPVATRVLNFWASNIINLKQNPKPHVREALLEKYLGQKCVNVHCYFILTEFGVSDLER